MAVQLVTKARTALPKSIGLEIFQIAYWPYLLYHSRKALLQVLMSCSDEVSPRSQRQSADGVEGLRTAGEEMGKAAWERSEAVASAVRLLASQFFSHLHALLCIKQPVHPR